MMLEGQIEITVGSAYVRIDSAPMAAYHSGHVEELKRAVLQACLAMDTDESRALAQRVEGTQ